MEYTITELVSKEMIQQRVSELAKEIQAQSPGISLEIAIAKATVDYWGDVIAKQREVC